MKANKILKNKYLMLSLITIIALFIRLLNIDKPLGLWYDEMITYVFASESFPAGIMKTLMKYDFHMPLYYLYVHFWMKLFGSADITLRLSSVIFGVLTIPAGFWLGKTYKSEKLGIFLASIMCLNPIMIYFSQEFRFYSIIIFLSTVSLVYLLKLTEAPKKKDAFFFGAINLMILYIYSTSLTFVFLEFFVLFLHFYLYKREYLKKFFTYSALFLILSLPYFYLLTGMLSATKNALILPFANYSINPNFLIVLINDWFSPFITSLSTQDMHQYLNICKTPAGLIILWVFSASSICFLIGFFKSFQNIGRNYLYLLFITLGFILIESVLYLNGQFILMTKYTLIILPPLLLICTDGLISIETKKLRNTCITIIALVYIYNTINYKNMISFSLRQGGNKIPAEIINQYDKISDFYILFPNKCELLKKYIPNFKGIELDVSSSLHLDKTKDEALKFFDKDFVYSTNSKNNLDKFTQYLINPQPTKQLKAYINSEIDKIPTHDKLIYVDAKQDEHSFEQIQEFVTKYQFQPELYKESLFNFVSRKMYWDTKNILDSSPKLKKIKTIETKPNKRKDVYWIITVYQKN